LKTRKQPTPDRIKQPRARNTANAAPGYDRHMRRFARWQRMAVDRLELQPGETVIDVGCGTGLTFPLLEAAVGETGKIVGIELSPEMVSQARERVAAQGWENVSVIEAAIETAEIDVVEYQFCSLDCAGKFASGPERYVERAG
jgi:ubiquinone/menaquinone biosynthesis C-methylase UbiE